MKLELDFNTKPHIPKYLWAMLSIICIAIVINQLPISWLSGYLSQKSACRIILQQPMGSIWKGSASIGFSESIPNKVDCPDPTAVTERFHWSTVCNVRSLSCITKVDFSALEKPMLITISFKHFNVAANEIKLPANILEALGNPWRTLRPRGSLSARWADLSVGSNAAGTMHIIVNNFISPISAVAPLGRYEIIANITPNGAHWNLSSSNGPLFLTGTGDLADKEIHFSGEASAAPEAEESLVGLLSLLGKKEGNIYRLKL